MRAFWWCRWCIRLDRLSLGQMLQRCVSTLSVTTEIRLGRPPCGLAEWKRKANEMSVIMDCLEWQQLVLWVASSAVFSAVRILLGCASQQFTCTSIGILSVQCCADVSTKKISCSCPGKSSKFNHDPKQKHSSVTTETNYMRVWPKKRKIYKKHQGNELQSGMTKIESQS